MRNLSVTKALRRPIPSPWAVDECSVSSFHFPSLSSVHVTDSNIVPQKMSARLTVCQLWLEMMSSGTDCEMVLPRIKHTKYIDETTNCCQWSFDDVFKSDAHWSSVSQKFGQHLIMSTRCTAIKVNIAKITSELIYLTLISSKIHVSK